jgi:hypothetical protein
MADKVEVKLSHPWRDKDVNDVVAVDADTASQLIRSGTGRAATVSDAKAAGVDPAEAASKK